MKCSSCGKEINSNERYCSFCGQNNEGYVGKKAVVIERHIITNNQSSNYNQSNQPTTPTYVQNYYYQQKPVAQPESITLSVFALIFGLLGGWLGLLLGIIGLTHYKEKGNKVRCGIAIGAWVIWVIILAIIIFS